MREADLNLTYSMQAGKSRSPAPCHPAPDDLLQTSEQHQITAVLSWQSGVFWYTALMWQGLVGRTTNSIQSVLFSSMTAQHRSSLYSLWLRSSMGLSWKWKLRHYSTSSDSKKDLIQWTAAFRGPSRGIAPASSHPHTTATTPPCVVWSASSSRTYSYCCQTCQKLAVLKWLHLKLSCDFCIIGILETDGEHRRQGRLCSADGAKGNERTRRWEVSRSWRSAGTEENCQEFAFCLKMLPQVAGRCKAPDRQVGVEKRRKGLFWYKSKKDYMFKQIFLFKFTLGK